MRVWSTLVTECNLTISSLDACAGHFHVNRTTPSPAWRLPANVELPAPAPVLRVLLTSAWPTTEERFDTGTTPTVVQARRVFSQISAGMRCGLRDAHESGDKTEFKLSTSHTRGRAWRVSIHELENCHREPLIVV